MSDPIADLDQAMTSVENIALMVANYYQCLLKAGVPDMLASALTIAYQTSMLDMGKKAKPE
jgi:hypothetical protein